MIGITQHWDKFVESKFFFFKLSIRNFGETIQNLVFGIS